MTQGVIIGLDISLEPFLREVEVRFVVLPISGRACVVARGLPPDYPKDPAVVLLELLHWSRG